MHRGYLKLWRKIDDNGWFKKPKLMNFWIWCLTRASYRHRTVMIGNQQIELKPGQFITGRNKAAEATGISPMEFRSIVQSLSNSKNLTIKSTNKYSIFTIVNWEAYQSDENENNQQINQHLTNKQPTNNQQITTNNKDKNIKKEKKKEYSEDFLAFYSYYPRRVDKDRAWKAWNSRNGSRPPLDVLTEAIDKQKKWRATAKPGDFRPEWKHPATWLNAGSWNDEIPDDDSTDPFEQFLKGVK